MIMIIRIFLTAFIFRVAAVAAFGTSEDIVERHFSAVPGGKLVVDVDFGVVNVATGGDNQIAVDAHRIVELPDQAQEKEFLAASPITITQEGNTTTIRSRSNRQWHWNGNHVHMHMEARYTLKVPRSFNADVDTRGGAISVSGLAGEVHANTAGGTLSFSRVEGPIDANTSGGDVKLQACRGVMKLRTNGGHVDSTGGGGSLDAQTSGGAVSIGNFEGSVQTASNGGRLKLQNISGPLKATTAGGAIDAMIATANEVRLETSAGAITVAVPPTAGFHVDAKAGVGRVVSELPVNAERKNGDTLVGSINGGGKELFLRTNAGSIFIRPAPAQTAAR